MLEDIARTGEAAAFLVDKLLTKDNDLFKEKDSSVMKLWLINSSMTVRLRNKQAVL